ncbi:putative nuclease HARBI1 [Schistocerca americana]|uniref:putative nuclease HARBI1 n=1 Tax=Schistocerca americana TaxID=7009 RepID=UPI001F4FE0BB|nr:putative nuclease HARBI1 [Schistocerca americana]
MSRQYIKFPSQAEVCSVMDGFNTLAGFHGVIGTVDFTHIRIKAQFENGEIPVGHLLGDSGYACRPYLLTPLSNPQGVAEHRYNRSHITSRNTVERQYVSTVVLHNIARSTSKEEPPKDTEIMQLLWLLRSERGPISTIMSQCLLLNKCIGMTHYQDEQFTL